MSIWGLTWPWAKKKGRTIESYDKKGHVRIKCFASASPVTGEIENHVTPQSGDGTWDSPLTGGKKSRWTRCPECECRIRVTGPLAHPRLTVHDPQCYTVKHTR